MSGLPARGGASVPPVATRERAVTLADGRELAVWEAGDPAGFPVVQHHGTPSTGLVYEGHARDAERNGVRLVGFDRAGYGASTARTGRTVADVVADVVELADALGIDRFGTWGISGGGPHALACAALLPDRVVGVASLAGVAPWGAEGLDYTAGMGESNLEEFPVILQGREPLRALLEPQREKLLALGEMGFTELFASLLGPADVELVAGPFAGFMYRTEQIALERGVEGWLDDDLAFVAPWGFAVESIAVPAIVWHGEQDRFVPLSHGRWLGAHIPGADLRISADDGHLTLWAERVPEVHAWLVEQSGRR